MHDENLLAKFKKGENRMHDEIISLSKDGLEDVALFR